MEQLKTCLIVNSEDENCQNSGKIYTTEMKAKKATITMNEESSLTDKDVFLFLNFWFPILV